MSDIVDFILAQLDKAEREAIDNVEQDPDSLKSIEKIRSHHRVVQMHQRDSGPNGHLCQVCCFEGQNLDCTYPCDFLRVYADKYRDRPGWRLEWQS